MRCEVEPRWLACGAVRGTIGAGASCCVLLLLPVVAGVGRREPGTAVQVVAADVDRIGDWNWCLRRSLYMSLYWAGLNWTFCGLLAC